MCAGSALRQHYGQEHPQQYRQEYRRCLERELRRGRPGPCSDPAFGQRLRQRLRREPALLGALQEDGPALLARGLRGCPDPVPALRGLACAFRLLELAAANLYLCPWRREFRTVQTFSGAYVHLLRPALPEADLMQSFSQLGYEQRDRHRLTISQLPPAPNLVAAACGFFACQLECEILVEVVQRLRPRQLRPEELLEARRVVGDADACVEMLQQLGTERRPDADCSDDVDLYLEAPASPEDTAGEDATSPALWKDPGSPWDMPRMGWDHCGDGECGQKLLPSTGNPEPNTSSSHVFPELGRAEDLPLTIPQEAPALPCYQLHSCLCPGALPSYCCSTCQQLHTGACAAGQLCQSRHRGQELRGERQQRLWLQRTVVDMLLADTAGPWA
ncbi:spermatogenesis-associated protein 2-like protein [Patagioenas fasciata]|uniref:Spermatogenesis-associated protein 2-like protein n=1 Tax=Patagioenas fasciata monilis TaxID=372326 RepID=A0A1V4K1N5_PATFA|nr:spermatogenesis-associated protein 2-like protein [Patagioenas fasciata monilis]